MRVLAAGAIVAIGVFGGVAVSAQAPARLELATLLHSAGEKVEQYFARAQSLVCLETVRLQPLTSGLTAEGFARTVESELRLSWDPFNHSEEAPEARTLRQVLRVNGRPPRKKDHQACTTPEQNDTETQPLSMLLAEQRQQYVFALGKPSKVDGRVAIVVDYELRKEPKVAVSEVEGQEDCISYDVDGGFRGRIWLDPDSHEVMRLDQGLIGLVEIPMPRSLLRRAGLVNDRWVMERWDTTIRFKSVRFQEPEETIMLPVMLTSLRVTRGAGMPRLRTITEYSGYKRFLTGGRVVPQPD
jgi:hypothetical protein